MGERRPEIGQLTLRRRCVGDRESGPELDLGQQRHRRGEERLGHLRDRVAGCRLQLVDEHRGEQHEAQYEPALARRDGPGRSGEQRPARLRAPRGSGPETRVRAPLRRGRARSASVRARAAGISARSTSPSASTTAPAAAGPVADRRGTSRSAQAVAIGITASTAAAPSGRQLPDVDQQHGGQEQRADQARRDERQRHVGEHGREGAGLRVAARRPGSSSR